MYKIMLVDDEPEVLDSMLETIDWAKYGFERPLACRDGAEAERALKGGFAPQAVISDISMPIMDGIELAARLRARDPKILVTVLSGYDEFSYAQKALQLNVFDYVLKPVTPAGMAKMLAAMRQELDARRLNDPGDALKMAGEDFLDRMLRTAMDEHVIDEGVRQHGIALPGLFHTVTVMDVDKLPGRGQAGAADLELMRYGLHNIVDELARQGGGALVLRWRGDCVKLVGGGGTAAEAAAGAKRLAENFSATAAQSLGVGVSAGIGLPVKSHGALHEAFGQANAALAARFYRGENSVLSFEDMPPPTDGAMDYSAVEARFDQALNAFDTAGAFAALDGFFAELRAKRVPPGKCTRYCQRLIVLLLRFAAGTMPNGEIETLEAAWEQHDLNACVSIELMAALTRRFCEQVFELMALVWDNSAIAHIKKAEHYIRQNAHNPRLSLQMVTEHLAVSTSYFSQLFKEQTGSTFVEYLTAVRMERAKNILAHTAKRTYEVADEVGFSDPHYFSAAFKKVAGMTPKEYREAARKQAEG